MTVHHRIVVGIDGSPQSAAALEWAVARARLGGERLELVSAYGIALATDFYGYHAVATAGIVEDLAARAQELADAAAAHVRELAPDLGCDARAEQGPPAAVLADASRTADAVVVGRRGLGAAASAVLGSVSNRLTVEARCPVVVVGEDAVPTSGPVVVGVDGSRPGTQALRHAITEAALRGTSVRAVAAYELMHPAFRSDPELGVQLRADVEAEATQSIAEALEDVRAAGGTVPVAELVVAEGRAADVILEHARDAQLVVVGTHGKGLARRVLLGSVSRRVLHDADRPVALVDRPRS